MASVYRRPQTQYWFAGWYDARGKFHLRSTKQTNRKQALAIALEFEHAENLARRRLLTEAAARDVLNNILERSGSAERLRMPTVRDHFRDWITDKELNTSEDTADRYRSVRKRFLSHLLHRADEPLAAVSPTDIQSYITKLRREGASGKTAKLHLSTLHGAFDKARRMGLLQQNPTEAVDVATAHPQETPQRHA
jgi:hypothetical protein